MTWNELNDWTDGGIEDATGYNDAREFLDEAGDDELWSCDTLTCIIECLQEERADMPSNYDGEWQQHTNMIHLLQEVR